MQVYLDTHEMTLEDMPLDEGYASESVTTKDINGKDFIVGGQTGKTQIIISAPFLNQSNLEEFDAIFNSDDLTLDNVEKYFLLASKEDAKVATDIPLLFDEEELFGDEYGVRISNGMLKQKLTKSLFIISKDGAIFYEDIPKDLNRTFEVDKIYQKTVAALQCYTGKGCH